MNVIRHQMSFLDPALLASRQIVKYLAQIPFYLAEKHLGVNTTWYLHSQVA
jgi:hypothetical protein